jgi:hypothetical protein
MRAFLEGPHGMKQFGAVLRTIAALDHVLARSAVAIRTSKPMLQQLEHFAVTRTHSLS